MQIAGQPTILSNWTFRFSLLMLHVVELCQRAVTGRRKDTRLSHWNYIKNDECWSNSRVSGSTQIVLIDLFYWRHYITTVLIYLSLARLLWPIISPTITSLVGSPARPLWPPANSVRSEEQRKQGISVECPALWVPGYRKLNHILTHFNLNQLL